MMKTIDVNPGDYVTLKKKHPCGSSEWEVLRLGADIRLKCRGCGHCVILSGNALSKNIKKITKNSKKT